MWYAITKNDKLVGATRENPYVMDLPSDMIVHEFDTQMPDLNYNDWDPATETFTKRAGILTKLEFYNRFNLTELSALETSIDPVIKVLQKQQMIAEYIDTTDPDTQMGVGYLYNIGMITYERMLEILS